jgi:hypothetical protein
MSSRPKVEVNDAAPWDHPRFERGEPILARTLLGRGDGGSMQEAVQLFVLDKTVKV